MFVRLRGRFPAWFDYLLQVLFVLASAFLVFIMLSVCLEIVMRYFFASPLTWIIEVSTYSLLFLTFLSAGWVLKLDKHVKIELVFNWLAPRIQSRLNFVTSLLAALIWLIITWYSIEATLEMVETHERIATILEPLKAPLFLIIPVGSFLLFVQSLRMAFGYLSKSDQSSEKSEDV
jgi:C4-dicarboxylate transporter DctQ subunit